MSPVVLSELVHYIIVIITMVHAIAIAAVAAAAMLSTRLRQREPSAGLTGDNGTNISGCRASETGALRAWQQRQGDTAPHLCSEPSLLYLVLSFHRGSVDGQRDAGDAHQNSDDGASPIVEARYRGPHIPAQYARTSNAQTDRGAQLPMTVDR